MSKKLSKIFILTFGISIFLYSISKTDFSFNLKLVNRKQNMCSNEYINDNFLKKYIQENANYTYTPKYKKENMNLTLFEKLEQNLETKEIINLSLKLFPLKAYLYLFIPLLIGIFTTLFVYFYCSCFFCNCFYCDNKLKGNKCPYFCLIFSIILYLIVVIISIFANKIKLQNGISTSFCSIEKFVINILNGDDNVNFSPRWIGINNFGNNLNNVTVELEKSLNHSKELKNQNVIIQNKNNELNDLIKNLLNFVSNQKIINPSKKDEKITPSFNELLMNDINDINLDLTLNLFTPILLINFTDSSMNDLSKVYQNIQNSFGNITKELNYYAQNFTNNFDNFLNNTIINELSNEESKFYSQNYIFIIIIILCILTIIFSILTISYYKMKYISFIGWSCLQIFIIPILCLGFLLGFLGFASQGIYSFISNELNKNNSRIFKDESIHDFIDVCYNGNGSLTSFNNNISHFIKETKIINDIYDKHDEIQHYEKELLNISSFQSIEKSKKEIIVVNMINNSKELIESLNEFNKYINYGDKEKYINEDSEMKPYEIFVTSLNKCLEGYNYTKFEDIKDSSEKDKLCFVITEWDKDKFNLRYKNMNISLSNSKLFSDVIVNYQNSLFSYINEVKDYIDNYRNKILEIDTKAKNLIPDIKIGLNYSINVINPIFNFFKPITKGLGIFSSLNCKFLHKDVNLFFEAIDDILGNDIRNLSFYYIIIGLCICIGSWFIIIAISRIAISDDERRKREGPLNHIILDPEPEQGDFELKQN